MVSDTRVPIQRQSTIRKNGRGYDRRRGVIKPEHRHVRGRVLGASDSFDTEVSLKTSSSPSFPGSHAAHVSI